MPRHMNRRDWIKSSSLIALATTIPAFLRTTLRAAETDSKGRILVVIQLDGGNDGINTVVPFTDEGYAKHRPQLKLPTDKLIKLNDQVGLHPAMKSMGNLFEDSRLAILQGVSYPNPNRSHDVSMTIWQTARLDPADHNSIGWLGRALDESPTALEASPQSMFISDQSPPVAIRGRKSAFATMNRLSDLELKSKRSADSQTAQAGDATADRASENLLDFVERTSLDAYTTSQTVTEIAAKSRSGSAGYPSNELGRRLEMISQLIKANMSPTIYYVSQSGYDTHALQLPTHERLLGDLSKSLKAFLDDLKSASLDDRVLVLCFSEFGRPLKENASIGTDHGTAGPTFIAGSRVKSGLYGSTPSLTDLDGDDLKMSLDFRQIYATVLEQWLNVKTEKVLGGKFEPLAFL